MFINTKFLCNNEHEDYVNGAWQFGLGLLIGLIGLVITVGMIFNINANPWPEEVIALLCGIIILTSGAILLVLGNDLLKPIRRGTKNRAKTATYIGTYLKYVKYFTPEQSVILASEELGYRIANDHSVEDVVKLTEEIINAPENK